MSEELQMIQGWSEDRSSYYKELEEFHKKHGGADSIVYSPETNCPIYAQYNFKPYEVFVQMEVLKAKIALANIEAKLADES